VKKSKGETKNRRAEGRKKREKVGKIYTNVISCNTCSFGNCVVIRITAVSHIELPRMFKASILNLLPRNLSWLYYSKTILALNSRLGATFSPPPFFFCYRRSIDDTTSKETIWPTVSSRHSICTMNTNIIQCNTGLSNVAQRPSRNKLQLTL
jgi:hypothetical protein